MSLAALDWTLMTLLAGRGEQELPVLRQILLPLHEHEARTRALAKRLLEEASAMSAQVDLNVVRDRVPVGGGSLPGFELDSWAIALKGQESAQVLAGRLRQADTPVLARVRDGVVLVDLRAVEEEEVAALFEVLCRALH